MTELRVELPDDVARRLNERAAAQVTTPERLAGEAVRSYVDAPAVAGSDGHPFAFIGMFDAPAGSLGAAEAERQLEDAPDVGFGR